jgi:hypothetical protein
MESSARGVPDAQGLNNHRQHLYGSVASASIPPESTIVKEISRLIE